MNKTQHNMYNLKGLTMKLRGLKGQMLRGAALLMVLGTVMQAKAQEANYAYIFYNATYGYLINNGGNPGVSTTFNKNAIWVANNTMGTTSRNVKSYTDGSKYFTGTNGSNGANGSFSLGNTNDNWQLRGTNYLNRANANRGYVRYNGSGFIVNQSNTGQNFTGQSITINNNAAVNPTISITVDGLEGAGTSRGIKLNGNVTGTYTPEYFYASVRNYNNTNAQTYYWTTTTDATTTQPTGITDWSDATYSWEVTTGGTYASMDGDVLKITANPTGNIVVTLTVSKGGYEGTKTITFTRDNITQAVNTETDMTDPVITPASAILEFNESQQFEVSATASSVTKTVPAHTTITGGDQTYYRYSNILYYSSDDFATVGSSVAVPVTFSWALTGHGGSLTPTNGTGSTITVTHTPITSDDLTATLTVTASATGVSDKTASVPITAYAALEAPTITRNVNSISLSTGSLGASIYYTTNDGTPSATNGTLYTGPFDLTESPTTIKAIAIRNGHSSSVTEQTLNMKLPTPVITIDNTGLATITPGAGTPDGTTIRYTEDNTTPTSSSPVYTSPRQLTNPQTIKAIAIKNGYDNSDVASGEFISTSITIDGRVILDDREDHSWSYYSDVVLPKNMRSLNPADVKITYYGNSPSGRTTMTSSSEDGDNPTSFSESATGVKVGIDADAHTFIYLKTLERVDGSTANSVAEATGRCAYTTIPNPFSVRPTSGTSSTKYRGFYRWRVKSVKGGTIYDAVTGGSEISANGTINAEDEIYFAPSSEYGMEVELEALWAQAYVGSGYRASVGYERNFVVNSATAAGAPATYSNLYPNGSTDGGTTIATSVPNNGRDPGNNLSLANDSKYENIVLSNSRTITVGSHYLCFGRGVSGSATVQGINGNVTGALNCEMRLESGTISQLAFVRDNGTGGNVTIGGRVMVTAILGSDYDRANNNDNTKLTVSQSNTMFFARAVAFTSNTNKDNKVFDCVVKSGKYQENYWTSDANGFTYTNSFYAGHNFNNNTDNHYPGVRYVTIEGGELGNVNGGRGTGTAGNNDNADATSPQTDAWKIAFSLRIKHNAIINGCVFGGAANTSAWGSKRIVLTGGKVYSWIAGGANGTNTTGGDSRTRGASYIYVGGNAEVGGQYARSKNGTLGGQVFGSGRGNENQAASMDTTHVAIADNAKIMKNGDASGNVYGGGNRGYAHKQSNIYILGGTVEGKVFGGAYTNNYAMPAANVFMNGGTVIDGVYGGSNNDGDVGNVTVNVEGGTVGTSSVDPATSETGHVFGSGYGSLTSVTGNVHVTIGAASSSHSDWPLIYGNVYGGGHAAPYTSTGHTFLVTGQNGKVVGNIYGSGKGSTAIVTGYTDVLIRGHINVQGSVFGGGQQAEVRGTTNVKVE